MTLLLDGTALAAAINISQQKRVKRLQAAKRALGLAIMQVGDDPASTSYIKRKIAYCEQLGIPVIHNKLSQSITMAKLVEQIWKYNTDGSITGIILQLPLPKHLDPAVAGCVLPTKDVDGLSNEHKGQLLAGQPSVLPPTPRAVIELLKANNIDIASKQVVIVGRSALVGRPLSQLFLNEDATVTVAHSKTNNLAAVTRSADILVVAAGHAELINRSHTQPSAVVVDVGINKLGNSNKLVGDCDFAALNGYVSAISPVPGGVGPVTVAMLIENLLDLSTVKQY